MKKVLFGLCSLISLGLSAQTAGELLQAKLNAMHTMTAEFKQTVKAKKREVSRSSGTMALERPGRFRWQTKSPMKQIIVADGKKMWVYDVDLEQVTVKKQGKSLGGTAALFLSGYNENLTKDFDVVQKNEGGSLVFDLKSRSGKANFQRIKLIFSAERLTGLVLHDQLGQTTFVTLNQVKSNPKLQSSLFHFVPPKGVDVVRQ